MNRYRWPLLIAVLTALGLTAWALFSLPGSRTPSKPVPAAAPTLPQPAPPPARESTDDDLVAQSPEKAGQLDSMREERNDSGPMSLVSASRSASPLASPCALGREIASISSASGLIFGSGAAAG